ncbi:hypothetical protein HK405_007104, partial [Cladochytrium tenue]
MSGPQQQHTMRANVATASHRRHRRAPPPARPPAAGADDGSAGSDVSDLDELALGFLPAPNAAAAARTNKQQKPQPRDPKRVRRPSPSPPPPLKSATTTATAAGFPGDGDPDSSFVSEAPKPPAVKKSKNDHRTRPADSTAVAAAKGVKLPPKRIVAVAAKAAEPDQSPVRAPPPISAAPSPPSSDESDLPAFAPRTNTITLRGPASDSKLDAPAALRSRPRSKPSSASTAVVPPQPPADGDLAAAYAKLADDFEKLKMLRFTRAERLLEDKDAALAELQRLLEQQKQQQQQLGATSAASANTGAKRGGASAAQESGAAMDQLLRERDDLQRRFDRLHALRYTEPEKLADDQRKAAAAKCAAFEKQITLLQESLAASEASYRILEQKATDLASAPPPPLAPAPPPPRKQVRHFTSQTPGPSVADAAITTDPAPSAAAAAGDTKDAQLLAAARDEARQLSEELARCIREKSIVAKDREDALRREAAATDKATALEQEAEALRQRLAKTRTQARAAEAAAAAATAAAQAASAPEQYVFSLERMLRFYEEMTGVTLLSVERATRALDDDDEDGDSDAEGGGREPPAQQPPADEIDRARRKSVRRMSMAASRRSSVAPAAAAAATVPVLVYKCAQKGAKG